MDDIKETTYVRGFVYCAAHRGKALRGKSKDYTSSQCTPGKDRAGAEAFGRKPVNWRHLLHGTAAVQCPCERVSRERVCLCLPLSFAAHDSSAATDYSLGYHCSVVVVFFTLTDRASTIPSNIRGCQSSTWPAGQQKIRGTSTKFQLWLGDLVLLSFCRPCCFGLLGGVASLLFGELFGGFC